jgi:hypothetical protein
VIPNVIGDFGPVCPFNAIAGGEALGEDDWVVEAKIEGRPGRWALVVQGTYYCQ